MNRIIAILASAMLLILVVTVDDSPARAASMNLFPAEGRKSLAREIKMGSPIWGSPFLLSENPIANPRTAGNI
jgi:hypothetical protein